MMGSPPLEQKAPSALPPVVERWVLDQEVSFLVEEVIAAVGAGGLGREELAHRLAAHPNIARVGEKHHTPRTVAHRAAFVVRLLLDEREERFLVPGHRFFPFCPLKVPPLGLRLQISKTATARVAKAMVSFTTLSLAHRLLDPEAQPDESPPGSYFEMPVYNLGDFPNRGPLPPELEFRCVDFERGNYVVLPHLPVSPGDWQKARSAFVKQLILTLQSPPPGPVFAARQLLHVVAMSLEKGWTLPVGPLGPLLVQDDRVDLAVVEGRTVFVLIGANAGPVPQDQGLEATLLGYLRNAEADLKQRSIRGSTSRYSWDQTRLHLSADVIAGEYWACRVGLDLSQLSTGLGFHCACPQFRERDLCKHGVILLRELITHLQTPGSEIGDHVREDLARPSWSRALASLDPILRDAAPAPTPTEVHRVTWRLKKGTGMLQVEPYIQKLQASGSWTRGRGIRPDRLADGEEPSATQTDLRAAEALGGSIHYGRRNHGDAYDALQCLVGHPHLCWEDDLDRTVRIEKGLLGLRFDVRDNGDLVPVFSAGGAELDAGDSWYAGIDGFVVFDRGADRVILARATRPVQQLVVILVAGQTTFPTEARAELVARLPGLEAALPVDLPAELAGEEVPADSRLRVRLAPVASSGLVASLRLRPLAGGPLVAPGEPPERVSDITEGKRVCVKRRLADEAERAKGVAAALGLLARPVVAPMSWVIESDDDALDLVASLQDEKWKDLVVEWDDATRKMLLSREATPKDLRVAVQDAQDWFGIDGELEIDGTVVPLAQVIQALREGRRYIPVTGGVWVRISKLFQDRLREMGDLLQIDHGKLRIGPEAAPLLRETVREIGLTKACRAWDDFLERFDRAMKIEPKPPKGFKAEFRPYQLEGYRWLSRLAAWGVGGILADDMGLGKTVQALALLIDRAKEGPALVVAPTSVSSNWIAECRRFAPKLRPVLYRETDREAEPDEIKDGDLVVISYAMAMRDVERLAKVKWGTLVLDEAQFVKNSQTKTAQAIRQIAAGWRVALTGTPIENHLGDLWSLFRAISPGLFGSWERFRERFAAPIERDHDPKRREALARLGRPFVLRRTKDQVLRDLPARTEIRLDAELSDEERTLYDQARFAALAKLATKDQDEDQRFQVLAALTRLRQLACHPRLVLPETKATSAKLELFLETVDELREGGHRALVFSQFTSLLALVREALDARGVKYQYLDGSTPAPKRDVAIAAFQGGEGDLFLISLKAGGTGLNLTAADYVIHLDPWWNPAVEDQATNRAHRIGQTRPVTVYRIVATKTIEEKILSLHASKRDLVEGVLDGADQAGKLSTEELIALIREG